VAVGGDQLQPDEQHVPETPEDDEMVVLDPDDVELSGDLSLPRTVNTVHSDHLRTGADGPYGVAGLGTGPDRSRANSDQFQNQTVNTGALGAGLNVPYSELAARPTSSGTGHDRTSGTATALHYRAAASGRPAVTSRRSPGVLAYLRSQGITSEATWDAFRLDQVADADLHRLLTPTQIRQLRLGGIWLPTFDPREPATIAGLVRLTPAQNQHRCIGTIAGIAGPCDLDRYDRVVLVTNPLVGMRLHQAGLHDVAIVEEAAALVALRPWLARRRVIIATHKQVTAAAVRSALGEHGQDAEVVILAMEGDFSDPVRATLGLRPRSAEDAPQITGLLLRDLHAAAERNLTSSAGMAALHAAGLDDPDLVRAYRLGYLPDDIRTALSNEARRALQGQGITNAIIIPAWDATGAVVDLLCLCAREGGPLAVSLFPQPRGLCAPVLTTAYDTLTITDTPRYLPRLWRSGHPVLLLRGIENAQNEAQRIAAGGVRWVDVQSRRSRTEIAVALASAGIGDERDRPVRGIAALIPAPSLAEAMATIAPEVASQPDEAAVVEPAPVIAFPVSAAAAEEVADDDADDGDDVDDDDVDDNVVEDGAIEVQPAKIAPAPPTSTATSSPPSSPPVLVPAAPPVPVQPTLVLVSHNPASEEAVYRFGEVIYRAQIPWNENTQVDVSVERGGRQQRDRLDLAVAAKRLRFAACAGPRVGVPPAEIATALGLLLPALQDLVAPVEPRPVTPVTTGTLTVAEQATTLADLRAPDLLARCLADLRALGCGGDADALTLVWLASISRLSEDPVWVVLTAATASERFPILDVLATITPPDALLHVSRLTDQALFNIAPDALRHRLLLIDDAAIIPPSVATALRILHARGCLSGPQVERDPVQGQWRTRFVAAQGPISVITATAGEVPEAMRQDMVEVPMDESPEQALTAQRLRVAALRQRIADTAAIARLQQRQLLLQPRPVLIPTEERIDLPPPVARHRVLRDACCSLIAASAILHQHQRLTADGHLVATADDIATATALVMPLAARYLDDLSPRAHTLLAALRSLGEAEFTMETVAERTPSWPRTTRRRALEELLRADCVVPLRGHQGQRRSYKLLATTYQYDPAQRQLGHLATLGHGMWPSANPETAHG
jgi:hypothetical protein